MIKTRNMGNDARNGLVCHIHAARHAFLNLADRQQAQRVWTWYCFSTTRDDFYGNISRDCEFKCGVWGRNKKELWNVGVKRGINLENFTMRLQGSLRQFQTLPLFPASNSTINPPVMSNDSKIITCCTPTSLYSHNYPSYHTPVSSMILPFHLAHSKVSLKSPSNWHTHPTCHLNFCTSELRSGRLPSSWRKAVKEHTHRHTNTYTYIFSFF